VPVTPCHIVICWLYSQPLILCLIFYLDIRRVGSGATNWWAEPSFARSSIILFPLTPECLGSQMSLTEQVSWTIIQCPMALSFQRVHSFNSLKSFKAAWLSEQILVYFSDLFLSIGQQPLVGQILLIIKASRSHSATLHSVELLWASDQPHAIDLYLTKHDTYKRQTSIISAGFEPTFLVSEGPHTHALGRSATGIVSVTEQSFEFHRRRSRRHISGEL